ncbi:MAG: hypothetical protein COT16_03675, partial [Elusimicrobia bacterium CG08_land_8_20_14_0_20_44_26]
MIIYLLVALTISFLGYKAIPRENPPQIVALPAVQTEKNIKQNTAEADNPPPAKAEAEADEEHLNLVEYIEKTVREEPNKNFTKENISPENESSFFSLPGEKQGNPPTTENADWIDAEIKTLVFTGFDEPEKSIINLFNRNENKKLEQLIQKDEAMEKSYKHFILGELKFKKGLYEDALKNYGAAAAEASSASIAGGLYEYSLFRKAESLYNTGKFDEALEIFDGIQQKMGHLAGEAEFSMAQCELKTGKTNQAMDVMNRLILTHAGYCASDRTNYCIGLILYHMGKYTDAKAFFEKIKNPEFENQKLSEFYFARCLENEGKLLQARALFKKIYEKNKKNDLACDAMFRCGMIFYRMKEYDSAADIFLNILRIYPSGVYAPDARLMTGYCRFEKGLYKTAIANCKYFMECYGNSARTETQAFVRLLLAKTYAKLKKYGEAYEQYLKIISENPGVKRISLTASCGLALLYYNTGKYEQALAVCEKLLKDAAKYYNSGTPTTARSGPQSRAKPPFGTALRGIEKDIALLKAMCLYRMNDSANAQAAFQGIINNIPDAETRGKALFMLGMQFVNDGKNGSLMTSFLDLSDKEDLFTDNWKAWAYYFIANAYYDSGKIDEAEKTYEYIIKTYQGAPAVKFAESARIACKVLRGQYADAEDSNREFAEKFKDDESAGKTSLLASAGLFFTAGNYKKAIADYNEFIKSYPSDRSGIDEALFMKGECFLKLRLPDEARRCFIKIPTGRNSEYALKAYNRLAYTSFGLGNYEDAVLYCRKIKKSFPANAEALKDAELLIAQSYYNSGKFTQAIAEYKNFLALHPDEAKKAEVLENIKSAYFEKGMKDLSGRGLADFVKLYPEGELAAEACWQLGTRAFEKKEYLAATKMFRKIILEYPEAQSSKLSLYYLAESLYLAGNNEEAVNAFNNFISSFPEDALRPSSVFHMANA